MNIILTNTITYTKKMVKCRLKFNKQVLERYQEDNRGLSIETLQERLWGDIVDNPYDWQDWLYELAKNAINKMSKQELKDMLGIIY